MQEDKLISLETAKQLFNAGLQSYGLKKFDDAVECLGQALEFFVNEYGQTHPKCANPYYRYGCALLQVAVQKSGILGDSEQVQNATGKREVELLSTIEDVVASEIVPNKDTSRFVFEGDVDDDEEEEEDDGGKEVTKDMNGNVISSSNQDEKLDAGEGDVLETEEGGEEGVEEDDFEIAFENLEMAKIIYSEMIAGNMVLEDEEEEGTAVAKQNQKQQHESDIKENGPDSNSDASKNNTENSNSSSGISKGKGKANTSLSSSSKINLKKKLAEVYIALGDVNLESESFDAAVEDYKKALELKQEIYSKENRQIAECHYKLALAYEYSDQSLEKAIEHMKETKNTLLLKCGSLQDRLEGEKITADAEDEQELNDVKNLIPELELKIEDLQDQLKGESDPKQNDDDSIARSTSIKDIVHDVSTLIKKKRQDEFQNEDSELKKRKIDDVSPNLGEEQSASK